MRSTDLRVSPEGEHDLLPVSLRDPLALLTGEPEQLLPALLGIRCRLTQVSVEAARVVPGQCALKVVPVQQSHDDPD